MVSSPIKITDISSDRKEVFQNNSIYMIKNAQLFKIEQNSDGTYSIFTKSSNNNSCVEVAGGSSNSGANIQPWGNSNGKWQHWIFEKVK